MSGPATPSLVAQATAVELQLLGLQNTIDRAVAGKIRRPPHEIERLRSQAAALAAARQSLSQLAAQSGTLVPA